MPEFQIHQEGTFEDAVVEHFPGVKRKRLGTIGSAWLRLVLFAAKVAPFLPNNKRRGENARDGGSRLNRLRHRQEKPFEPPHQLGNRQASHKADADMTELVSEPDVAQRRRILDILGAEQIVLRGTRTFVVASG